MDSMLIYNSRIKSLIAFLLTAFIILGCAGCAEEEADSGSEERVFAFAGENVSLGEVYLYAEAVIQDYESMYGTEIWQTNVSVTKDDTANMEDVTRRDIIEDIVHVKLLAGRAAEEKIALTEDEVREVEQDTDSFYENLTDTQIDKMEISYDLVKKVINENKIAGKVYDKLIDEADIEVSDEEARETTFYDLYFECYAVASSGDVTDFSEDEKAAQYDRAVQAYNTLINPIDSGTNDGTSATNTGSTNIEGLAEYYGLKNSSYYTMTPSEIEGVYGSDIYDDLYSLEDGSYSLVTESEYGYHIFYMKALTDREATDAHKSDIMKTKKNSYMEELYTQWLAKEDPGFSYEKSVDFNIYYKIEF